MGLPQEIKDKVVEWDEFGQGYDQNGKVIVCICGAVFPDGDRSNHYCVYDTVPEDWDGTMNTGGP